MERSQVGVKMPLKSQATARSSTRNFIREIKYRHYTTVKKNKCRGLTVAYIKTFGLGFDHIKGTKFNFLLY
jgi:hypothetical protein